MRNYYAKIKNCPLFFDISTDELDSLLICISAFKKDFEKGEYVFRAGAEPVSVGIVLSGGVNAVQEDFWGNRTILTRIDPGGLFGEAFSCAETDILPISVVTVEKSEIMLIDYKKLITTCSSSCIFHANLIKNMLKILAKNNITLMQKIEFLSHRTIKDKILSYLSVQAIKSGSNIFTVPFNRQELADFLCVDRSALSRELSTMQAEGIVKYGKNQFELLNQS